MQLETQQGVKEIRSMIPEKAETGDIPRAYEWNESAGRCMWEVFGISRETITRMEEAATIIRDIVRFTAFDRGVGT